MSVRILHGALQDRIPELIAEGVQVDAIVTDPPYELGFMGKKWDASGVANDPATWALAMGVLKPGGHLLAFGGTRTHHRVMCAIEDAGFELRDVLMWVYGSGFPKSKNHPDEYPGMGSALKPAWEPIIMARKPLAGTLLANMQAHGVGMIDVDACRVGDDGGCAGAGAGAGARVYGSGLNGSFAPQIPGLGRWPANVAHDGSDEVLTCFPDAPGQIAAVKFSADEWKTGAVYGSMKRGHRPGGFGNVVSPRGDRLPNGPTYGDGGGSAARFFYCAKADRTDRNEGCEHLQAKPLNWSSGTESPGTFQAEGTDRTSPNHHPTVKPTELMRWLVRMVTPKGGLVLDCFGGSGSTGKAAVLEGRDCILIEREAEYIPIIEARLAYAQDEYRAATAQAPLFAEVA